MSESVMSARFFPLAATFCAALIGLGAIAQGPIGEARAEAGYLESFVGDWRGQGSFRRGPEQPAESVVCRAQGSLDGNGQLQVRGRCGGDGFTGTFRVNAVYDPGTDRYSALFAGPPSVGSSELTGQRRDNRIELAVNHPGQPPSTLHIGRPTEQAFHLRSETAPQGGPSFVSADIQLQRQ